MASFISAIQEAWANFDLKRQQWPGTLNRGTIYRMTCKQASPGQTLCSEAGCLTFEYDIQFMIADRHNQESVFKSWAAPGVPSYSADALVTGQWGFFSGAMEPGTFPHYICKEGLCEKFLDYLGVLAIGLPDMVTRPAPGLGSRFRLIPEKDYPDAFSMPHNKRAGDFDFNQIGNWANFWANRAKEIAFEHFGTTRPRPELYPDYAFRLVYVASHRGFQIQRAFRPGASVDWQQFDQNTGSPLMHLSFNDVVSLVFDGNSLDHPPSAQLYSCDTVLGIHPPVNPAYTLANYSYEGFAHKKETGSFDFKTVGCGGEDCQDPGTNPPPQPGNCQCPPSSLIVFDPDSETPGRAEGAIAGDSTHGWITNPETGAYFQGFERTQLEGLLLLNENIREQTLAICAVGCEIKNLREALSYYLNLLAIKDTNVDTTALENAIKAQTQKLDDAFFTTITQS